MMSQVSNPSLQDVEAGELEVQSHPWLHVNLKANLKYKDSIMKNKDSSNGSRNYYSMKAISTYRVTILLKFKT